MSDLILQQLINGISIGIGYALVALGLTLVFGVLHVLNFAHGEFYMLGGLFVAVLCSVLKIPYLVALPAAALAVAAVSIVVDRIAVKSLLEQKDGATTALLTTFAISLLIHEAAFVAWGTQPVRIDGILGTMAIGTQVMSYQRLLLLVVGLVLFALLEAGLRWSEFGRALRAIAQSGYAARVTGINVSRIRTITFVLAGGIAGLAGALLTPVVLFSPAMGQYVAIKAFVIVVVGGMGSVAGAVVGGLCLGIIEAVLSTFLNSEIATALIYAALLLTLLVRPNGLFGKKATIS